MILELLLLQGMGARDRGVPANARHVRMEDALDLAQEIEALLASVPAEREGQVFGASLAGAVAPEQLEPADMREHGRGSLGSLALLARAGHGDHTTELAAEWTSETRLVNGGSPSSREVWGGPARCSAT